MKKLVVGLGNPGEKYRETRHNIGFLAIEKILGSGKKFKEKKQALYYEENNIIYLLPQTYMNRSGEAIQSFMAFYKIKLDDLVVIHDDLDLSLGQIKVKIGGGTGGHNGLKSIDALLGNKYLRVRLGIGKPQAPLEVSDFVLQNFSKDEKQLVDKMLNFLSHEISILLSQNIKQDHLANFLEKYSRLKIL